MGCVLGPGDKLWDLHLCIYTFLWDRCLLLLLLLLLFYTRITDTVVGWHSLSQVPRPAVRKSRIQSHVGCRELNASSHTQVPCLPSFPCSAFSSLKWVQDLDLIKGLLERQWSPRTFGGHQSLFVSADFQVFFVFGALGRGAGGGSVRPVISWWQHHTPWTEPGSAPCKSRMHAGGFSRTCFLVT